MNTPVVVRWQAHLHQDVNDTVRLSPWDPVPDFLGQLSEAILEELDFASESYLAK